MPVHSYTVTRDRSSRIDGREERIGAGAPETLSYAHDDAGRLTGVVRGGDALEAYGYDARGNRTSRTIGDAPAEEAAYALDDRLQGQGSAEVTQDVDGHVTRRGDDTFSYGTQGELLSASAGGLQVKPPKACLSVVCVGDVTKALDADQWIFNAGERSPTKDALTRKGAGENLERGRAGANGTVTAFTCQKLLF